jgi:GNAT superfamily N-acetyltransferase
MTALPFQAENQVEVRNLILSGLAEHWGVLDLSKNSDLNDISSTYTNAVFLVAWYQKRIIGTGALIPRSNTTAEIVRMSVAADMRRKGIGRKILQQLCEYAKSSGYEHIILETTETWSEVIEFYRKFGFHITHHLNGDIHFALELL